MNRSNIWIHICVALILVTLAAVLGQISKLKSGLRPQTAETRDLARPVAKPTTIKRAVSESEPEVLVRFKKNVTRAQIDKLVAKNNDRIEDRLELVAGLKAVDDLDNADPETVAQQYASMTDFVEYAEVNYEITIDEKEFVPVLEHLDKPSPAAPNDPHFGDQWGLNNDGQNGGKKGADVAATKAWEKTKGSEEVVVAVLDTGVDYTHPDLASNMWTRPDNIPAYNDVELGTFNDRYGFNAADNFA
ncbi:MAG: hypothetical protein KF685_02345, partial [Acidobacteria bacterium]|nr:hypothetical protein [Acidobacteriota bacterium]